MEVMTMKVKISKYDALIIVDVQYDFLPGGSLPVPEGNKIIPILNNYIKLFRNHKALIVASRDWHPKNHSSFKKYGGMWPEHCIQNTKGAQFHSDLNLPDDVYIVSKAMNPNKDAYSAFQDTLLAQYLRERQVRRVFVGGLATDYCVKATVLDALKEGFCTFFLEDASRGVNIHGDDVENAISEMLEKGSVKLNLADII